MKTYIATPSTIKRDWFVIDASGRVQLPPEARALFPTSRVAIEVQDGRVVLTPPEAGDG